MGVFATATVGLLVYDWPVLCILNFTPEPIFNTIPMGSSGILGSKHVYMYLTDGYMCNTFTYFA